MKSKFFCDLHGTFIDMSCSSDISFNGKEIDRFVKLLQQLDNSDEMSISFVSTEDIAIVRECMMEIVKRIKNTKIKLGVQYSENECITANGIKEAPKGKAIQIIKDLVENKYDKVYYADDSDVNQKIIGKIFERKFRNLELVEFIPGENSNTGITGLNKLLQEHILKNHYREQNER